MFRKLPVGDGTSVEEKDADEDGGEGGEVPQVQDGADQGHAAQLPVVAGDRESFHLISISRWFFLGELFKKAYSSGKGVHPRLEGQRRCLRAKTGR